jgi:hypothetical protein
VYRETPKYFDCRRGRDDLDCRCRGALIQASAQVDSAQVKQAPKAEKAAPSGLSATEKQFVTQVGAAVIRNQAAISNWRSWVVTRPGIAGSGYMGTIDDLAHKATTIMWHGARTPFLAALVNEGARRGIKVSVQSREYSMAQLKAAAAAVWQQARQGKWAGCPHIAWSSLRA